MSDLRDGLRLYLVTDPQLCAPLGVMETVRRAVAGGVSFVQLRDKAATTRERVELARAVKDVLSGRGVPLVINDDVEAAVAADVDGAHIGQGDMTPAIGFDGLASLVALSPLPTVAIGGLKADHVEPVRQSGADGLAVVSAICGQPDVTAAAQAFAQKEVFK